MISAARGNNSATHADCSGAFEFVQTLPTFVIQPMSTNVLAGTDVAFQALATGTGPIGYFWIKDDARQDDVWDRFNDWVKTAARVTMPVDSLEEGRSPGARLDQGETAIWTGDRQRNAGKPGAAPNVEDRGRRIRKTGECAERIYDMPVPEGP